MDMNTNHDQAVEDFEDLSGVGKGQAEGSKATQFRPGQSGNPGGKPKEDRDHVPDLLKAMRWVTTRPESKDRTQLQKECRAWLKEDRSRFLSRMADLEKAFASDATKERKGAVPAAPETPEVKSQERIRELITEWLKENA